jgi:NAD(P)-dependent dehydrogenase (short-subunit alcohol dehydrogenase family)
VNINGVFLCMKYEIKAMLRHGGGAIVNIGSGNEHSSNPGLSWYLGAKQATYGMTKCAALDYGAHNIRVNAVGPGSMWTPGLRETAQKIPEHVETLAARSALKRLADPEEVAETAVWLCTSRASYVTGHTLVADGGAISGMNTARRVAAGMTLSRSDAPPCPWTFDVSASMRFGVLRVGCVSNLLDRS